MNMHKKVCFEWFNAFQPSVSYKQYALPFEKAGILFNLGAILSEAATKKYRESEYGADKDDLLKNSLLYLQQASGLYQFLSENYLHAPSNDLGQLTVKYLVQLMLAQASEVFALKVISGDLDQSKKSLISKYVKEVGTL
ncbi:hypothetical protein CAAN1_17S02740 [[Candida] anglica]|uniref:BRO domain-containing protein 1 n=1 Tax=[Candida] anglica TaxID=148631 RepID=A0ABP0E7B5_9ASCO